MMCPTFVATGEEIMSTRGRANAIRAALEMRGLQNGDPLRSVRTRSGAEQLSLVQSLYHRMSIQRGTWRCSKRSCCTRGLNATGLLCGIGSSVQWIFLESWAVKCKAG